MLEVDLSGEVLRPEDLVQQRPYEMHVLVANLDEDRARLGQR